MDMIDNPLEYGTLLWIRPGQSYGITVPLTLLTNDQYSKLEEYLLSDEYIQNENINKSRLVWEYFFDTDGGRIVPVISLSREQKATLLPPTPTKKKGTDRSSINQLELKERLLADEISWQAALEIITSIKGKPWQTKEWKEKRDSLIGDSCEQCGSTEPPFVLQHTWQPQKISNLFYLVRSEHQEDWEQWEANNPVVVDLEKIPPNADGCPKCSSEVIRYRKHASTWICRGVKNGVMCEHVFEKPIKVVSHETIRQLGKSAKQKRLEEFDDKCGIGKEVVLRAIDQHLRYISLKDTKTLCKKCAFVADRTDLKLCSICQKNYHKPRYKCCYECAQKNHG